MEHPFAVPRGAEQIAWRSGRLIELPLHSLVAGPGASKSGKMHFAGAGRVRGTFKSAACSSTVVERDAMATAKSIFMGRPRIAEWYH